MSEILHSNVAKHCKLVSVSIIIPVFNVEFYIEDCLNSVAAQQYSGSIECIIVDDCGNDRSMDIVRNFIESYNGKVKFIIIEQPINLGLSSARNHGLREATGEYVYFLDSDDEITPYCINSLASNITENRYDYVVGEYSIIGTDIPFPHIDYEDKSVLLNQDILYAYTSGHLYMMAWNKLCNRDFLLRNNLWFKEGILHEDELWSFMLSLKATSVFISKEICYIYKVRSGSITTTTKKYYIDRRLLSLVGIYKDISQVLIDEQLYKNQYVSKFVQGKWYELMATVWRFAPEESREYYKIWHEFFHNRLYLIEYNSKSNLKCLVKNVHLMLPEYIGYRITRIILKIKKNI